MLRTSAAIAVLSLAAAAVADPLALTHRSLVPLPATATDQHGATFTIAGLSGITRRVGHAGEFLAVMDNSNKLVRLHVELSPDGSITSATVLGGISLAETRDFEGVAFIPGADPASPGTVLLAEEGTPAIHEFDLTTGARLRTLSTPPVFAGRRANFGFESLTRRAIRADVWTANEEALTADGPLSSPTTGTTVRLLRLPPDDAPGPSLQWAYTTEPMHGLTISGARSGLCDLVALPSGGLLALERSLALGAAGLFQTRIYEVTTTGATDVSPLPSLTGQTFTPAAKRLLCSGSLNNLEGLALGPRLAGPGRRYALLGIVDDGDPVSVNALASFELTGPVACAADFNDDALVSVQDLFDFLAAYFGADADADINQSGDLTVQDLFDFLAAYFAACP